MGFNLVTNVISKLDTWEYLQRGSYGIIVLRKKYLWLVRGDARLKTGITSSFVTFSYAA
jgi:hypothetical protein